jgi:hypothetical protein
MVSGRGHHYIGAIQATRYAQQGGPERVLDIRLFLSTFNCSYGFALCMHPALPAATTNNQQPTTQEAVLVVVVVRTMPLVSALT